MWFVYICDQNCQFYTGITTDSNHRMNQHKVELLYSESYSDKYKAARKERQIKNWLLLIIRGVLVPSVAEVPPGGIRVHASEPNFKPPTLAVFS